MALVTVRPSRHSVIDDGKYNFCDTPLTSESDGHSIAKKSHFLAKLTSEARKTTGIPGGPTDGAPRMISRSPFLKLKIASALSFGRKTCGGISKGPRFGVDGIERHLAILRPERNLTPTHDGQVTLTCLRIKPHDWLKALRGYVVGRRKIGVVKNISLVSLHPLCDALFVRPSAASSAHGSSSIDPFGDFPEYPIKDLMRQIG